MPTLYIVGIVIAVIIFLCIFVTVCYKKAPPTEAIVITGLGHREPKVVCGKGAFVIPFVQRADTLDMRIMNRLKWQASRRFVREACYTLRQQVLSGIIYVQRFSVFCLLNYVKNRIDEKN